MIEYGDNSNGGSQGNSGVAGDLDREDNGARPGGRSTHCQVSVTT